jgi:hypothetical protein
MLFGAWQFFVHVARGPRELLLLRLVRIVLGQGAASAAPYGVENKMGSLPEGVFH